MKSKRYLYEQIYSIGGRDAGVVFSHSSPDLTHYARRITKADALKLLARRGYRGQGGKDQLAVILQG